jgi:hypothetical protein
VEFFGRTISKARSVSMKLRAAVVQDFDGMEEYRRAFSSMCTGNAAFVEVDALGDFCEDMLDMEEGSLTDKDAKDLYAIVDKDGDGKVSVTDFVEYVVGQSAEAVKLLSMGNSEVVVDLQASASPAHEAEVSNSACPALGLVSDDSITTKYI